MQVRIQRSDPARILLNVDDIPHTTNRALKLAQRELELSSPEELDSSSSSSEGDAKNRMWLRMQGMLRFNRYYRIEELDRSQSACLHSLLMSCVTC